MDRNLKICWLLIIVPVSIFLGYITNSYEYFVIEKNINLVDLFNLIITIFIAFYFSFYLQKQTEKDKMEKDFIMNKLYPILRDCESLKSFVRSNPNKNKINEILSNISNSLYYSNKFSIACNKKIDVDDLKNKMISFKSTITGGKMNNNRYIINDIKKSTKEIEEFEELLVKQIIRTNKM